MILEVFSCSGGFAEGLRRAGLPVTMAFDHDADACDSYEANLGHRPVQMDARDLLRMVQGFSESWVFCGKTKRARWSQIGQAMPPPLAEAVGRSIAVSLRRAKGAT